MPSSFLSSIAKSIRSSLICITEMLHLRRRKQDSVSDYDNESQDPDEQDQSADDDSDNINYSTFLPREPSNRIRLSFPLVDKFGRDRARQLIYDGMELVVYNMMDPYTGVPVYTVRRNSENVSFVFTGSNLVKWLMKHMRVDEENALYFGNLLASLGFLFSIDDHSQTVNNNNDFYRFQSSYYWKSGVADGNVFEYAGYLTRRLLYSSADKYIPLTTYELQCLEDFKRNLAPVWGGIQTQAIRDVNYTESYTEEEKQFILSQQHAFWDLNQPVPGSVLRVDFDYEKLLEFKHYYDENKLEYPVRFPEKFSPEETLNLKK